MSSAHRMERPAHARRVVWREVEGRGVLVHVDSGDFFELDAVGIAVWETCDGETSIADIAEDIAERFGAAPEEVERDVLDLVGALRARKLILDDRRAEWFMLPGSAYDERSARTLAERVRQLGPDDWPSVRALMSEHALEPYLWRNLQRSAGPWPLPPPPDVVEEWLAAYQRAEAIDLRQENVLEEICAALGAAPVPIAVVKGVALQRSLYAGLALPRGAANIDVFVFADRSHHLDQERSAVTRAAETLTSLGFSFVADDRSRWEESFSDRPFFAFEREQRGERVVVNLVRAPSPLHLIATDKRTLVSWLEGERRTLSWRSGRGTTISVPGLSPAGMLVYLCINLLHARVPSIRNINDVSLLVERHDRDIDWEKVSEIARRSGHSGVIGFALDLVRGWRILVADEPPAVPIPTIAYSPVLRRVLSPYLDVSTTLCRERTSEVPIEDPWLHVAFGSRSTIRRWAEYERTQWQSRFPEGARQHVLDRSKDVALRVAAEGRRALRRLRRALPSEEDQHQQQQEREERPIEDV